MDIIGAITLHEEEIYGIAFLGVSPNRNSDIVNLLIEVAGYLEIPNDIPECTPCNDKLKNMAKAIYEYGIENTIISGR